MPNLTTPIPPRLTGSAETDVAAIRKWGTALIDELTYILANLDAGNVTEASSVKAENIDTSNAKISNAQIGALTADKIVTGSLDTARVTVEDENGTLNISGSKISILDIDEDTNEYRERFKVEYIPPKDNPLEKETSTEDNNSEESNKFELVINNSAGEPTVYMDDGGNAVFSGSVISSNVYSSHIVGTDQKSYDKKPNQVFAEVDKKGIKIMQDKDNVRLQKIGMSVSSLDGTAYMILGAGDGSGSVTINGVTYSNGALVLEKDADKAKLGICGSNAWILLNENSELDLNGAPILINGRDILAEIDALKTN